MKFYAVTGRIAGDDEDTCMTVGYQLNRDSAVNSFIDEIRAIRNRDTEDTTEIFISSVFSSGSPITEE